MINTKTKEKAFQSGKIFAMQIIEDCLVECIKIPYKSTKKQLMRRGKINYQ